jgi:hypothetical protein
VRHTLERNWHEYFSRDLELALTIDPGDTFDVRGVHAVLRMPFERT